MRACTALIWFTQKSFLLGLRGERTWTCAGLIRHSSDVMATRSRQTAGLWLRPIGTRLDTPITDSDHGCVTGRGCSHAAQHANVAVEIHTRAWTVVLVQRGNISGFHLVSQYAIQCQTWKKPGHGQRKKFNWTWSLAFKKQCFNACYFVCFLWSPLFIML